MCIPCFMSILKQCSIAWDSSDVFSKTSLVDHLPKLTIFGGAECWSSLLLLFGVSVS